MSSIEEVGSIEQPAQDTADIEVVLSTTGLTKHFGQRVAVNDLDLEVKRGDVFGLLGPNGSGKTTTIRMIFGLVRPNRGSVRLFGQDILDASDRRQTLKRTGAIIEQPTFYPFLSGRENLRGIATFCGMPDNRQTHQRVEEALAQVGLLERGKDAYKKYSFGMKQRLGIAAALLNQPELIVLDEPTNGLDPAGVVEIRQLIRQLAQQGITVLLSSHLLYEVQQVCNRVAIIKLGNLLYQGTVQSMLANGQGMTFSFLSPEMLQQAYTTLQTAASTNEQFQWLQDIHIVPAEQGLWSPPGGQVLRVHIPVERGMEINRLLAEEGIYATEIRQHQSNLEQVFLEVTGPTPPQVAPVSFS